MNTLTIKNFNSIVSPLDQFEIRDLLSLEIPNLHLAITNIGLYLMISIVFILVLKLLSTNFNKLVSNK
jgi:F-type H+-transporting ATPase subunit a